MNRFGISSIILPSTLAVRMAVSGSAISGSMLVEFVMKTPLMPISSFQ